MEDEKNLSLYAYNLAEDALVLAKKAMENGGGDPQATGYTKEESDARYPTKQQVSSTYATKAALQNTNNDVTAVNQAVMDVEQDVSDLKTGLAGAATKTELTNGLSGKVDKVSGKGLSTNDYTTADKNKLAGLSNYNDTAIKAEIGAVANNGAKNLLEPVLEDKTLSGITCTNNGDGTYTFNGTATRNQVFGITLDDMPVPAEWKTKPLKLTGCPSDGSSSKYRVNVYDRANPDSPVTIATDFGSGVVIDLKNVNTVRIAVVFYSGYTANNLVFKPMLRDASITDATFVPYAPTNRELYEMILALMPQASLMSYTDDLAND